MCGSGRHNAAVGIIFGSWNAALAPAGLVPTTTRRGTRTWSDEALLDAIREVAREGRVTSTRFRSGSGLATPATIATRLGSWSRAVQLALGADGQP